MSIILKDVNSLDCVCVMNLAYADTYLNFRNNYLSENVLTFLSQLKSVTYA